MKFLRYFVLLFLLKFNLSFGRREDFLLSQENNLFLRCNNTRVTLNRKTMEEMCFINFSSNRGCHHYELIFETVNKFRVPCTLTTLIPNANQINYVEIFGGGQEHELNYMEIKYDLDVQSLWINTTLNISSHSIMDSYFLENVTSIIFSEVKTGIAEEFLNYRFKAPHLNRLALLNSDVQNINLSSLTQYQRLTEIHLHGISQENVTFNKAFLNQFNIVNISNCGLKNLFWSGEKRFGKSRLKTVDLSNNKLKKIPEFFVNVLKKVKKFFIKGNRIETGGCSFYHLSKFLFKIEANVSIRSDFNTKAISIPPLTDCSWGECPFLCNCYPATKTVDCSNKGLENVPEIGPSETEVLLLQDNILTKEGMSSLFLSQPWCNIRSLNLARNHMSQILPESKIQGVCQCQRKTQSSRPVMCFLPHLVNLTLRENALSDVTENDWKLIRRCANVDLSHNKITDESLKNQQEDYSTNQILNLSFNKLKILTKDVMKLFPFIVHMNLSNNQLRNIDFNLTSLSPLLQVLDLSNNNLNTMSPTEMSAKNIYELADPYAISLPDLKALYLHNNKLKALTPSLWHSLKYLTLRNNDWNCSYKTVADMQYFIWKNLEPNVVAEFKNLKCRNGSYLRDIEIKNGFDKNQHCAEKSFILISCTIIIFAIVTFFGSPLWKYFAFYFKKYIFHRKVQNDIAEREYDVFVYYCDEDTEKVNNSIIPELLSWDLKIIHPKEFIFGAYNLDQFKEALSSSRRMVAIISENFFKSKTCIFGLRKGIEEEVLVNKFKIACFYIENVQTPTHVDSSIRSFLECKCIKHSPHDMWTRNLKKFILGNEKSRKLSVTTSSETHAFDNSSYIE